MEVLGKATTQLEPAKAEHDLVVLGSGKAGKYIAWTLGNQGKRARLSSANTSAVPAPILHTYRAKTLFTAPRARRISEGVTSSESN